MPMIQKLEFGIQTVAGTDSGFLDVHCMADDGNVAITPEGIGFPVNTARWKAGLEMFSRA